MNLDDLFHAADLDGLFLQMVPTVTDLLLGLLPAAHRSAVRLGAAVTVELYRVQTMKRHGEVGTMVRMCVGGHEPHRLGYTVISTYTTMVELTAEHHGWTIVEDPAC